jgi:peptidoglycan/LPS O-acetylase OafA/YrhL
MAQLMDYLSDDIWEILLVKWNGMNDDSLLLNGPAWTLSSMCIVGLLLWGLLTHCKKPFLQLIMPVTLLIGYGFWRHIPAANTELWIGFTTFGTFRTYLVMCLGYYCMLLSKTLHKVSFNRYGEVLLGICELLIHIFATWVMFHRETRNYQWLVTLLFLVAVAIAVSGKSYLCKLMNKVKAFSFLGEISMSIYLIHVPIIWLFKWKNDMSAWSYRELIPVFAAVLAAAVLHYYLTKWLIKAVPKAGRWIVGHFVSQENG